MGPAGPLGLINPRAREKNARGLSPRKRPSPPATQPVTQDQARVLCRLTELRVWAPDETPRQERKSQLPSRLWAGVPAGSERKGGLLQRRPPESSCRGCPMLCPCKAPSPRRPPRGDALLRRTHCAMPQGPSGHREPWALPHPVLPALSFTSLPLGQFCWQSWHYFAFLKKLYSKGKLLSI